MEKVANTKNRAIRMHPVDSEWDYSIDLRLHLKGKDLDQAIRRAEKLCNVISRKVPWAYLVIKSWKD